ncbi:hypothetical protein BDW66DRAFT_132082 [Aspergillus desertorum]
MSTYAISNANRYRFSAINSLEGQANRNTPGNLAIQSFRISAAPQTPSGYQQRPYPVDLQGVEQLHRHQRSATGSSKGEKETRGLLPIVL